MVPTFSPVFASNTSVVGLIAMISRCLMRRSGVRSLSSAKIWNSSRSLNMGCFTNIDSEPSGANTRYVRPRNEKNGRLMT